MAKKSQRRRRRNNKSRSRRVKGGGTANEWIDAFTTFQSLKTNRNFKEVLDKIVKAPRPTQEEFVAFLEKYPDFHVLKDKITAMTPDEYIDFIVVYPMTPDATFTASDDEKKTMWRPYPTDIDVKFFKYF
jgi:hypothetical protein